MRLPVLCSESGARRPSHGAPPQLYPPAHAVHSQVWVHWSPGSPAVLLLLTVSNPTLSQSVFFYFFLSYAIQIVGEGSGGLWFRFNYFFCQVMFPIMPLFLIPTVCVVLQQWERQPGRKHVHALCQWTRYWESRGEWLTFTYTVIQCWCGRPGWVFRLCTSVDPLLFLKEGQKYPFNCSPLFLASSQTPWTLNQHLTTFKSSMYVILYILL